jgi:hypothetical protein
MKILSGTSAYIKGKIYPEGSAIPKEYEAEFENFLIDTGEITINVLFNVDDMPQKKSKNISKKKKENKL